jgi:hypothetical protein
MSQRLADIFASASGHSAHERDVAERIAATEGVAPMERRCETKAELAAWFKSFAVACRASLPTT